MKTIEFLKFLFALLSSVSISAPTHAQNFKLIDVNKITNSNPTNTSNSSYPGFAELKGMFYFAADDGIHGTELYKSDGTSQGTELVKDITPGTASSYVSNITAGKNKIYFTTSDDVAGYNPKIGVS